MQATTDGLLSFKKDPLWLLILFCIRRSEYFKVSCMFIFCLFVFCSICFFFRVVLFLLFIRILSYRHLFLQCVFFWMNKKEKVVVLLFIAVVCFYFCFRFFFVRMCVGMFKTCLFWLSSSSFFVRLYVSSSVGTVSE